MLLLENIYTDVAFVKDVNVNNVQRQHRQGGVKVIQKAYPRARKDSARSTHI
jgi:hypothetical protein